MPRRGKLHLRCCWPPGFFPDMLPLTRQVQLVCDFAAKTCARLTAAEVPSMPDTEKTFAELQARHRERDRLLKAYTAAQFDGAEPAT